ncbi:MAG TPA: hypothetical protein VKD67_00630 [Acidimicrobiales bacterium]|nr:hypothetical protein [Acidimicrobiales bacterium]
MRLPEAVERVVKPLPAEVTVLLDAAAPKSRSLAFVVVALPLDIALELPVAEAVTSNGEVLSSPEYSWTYTTPQALMAVENVARTVLLPATMFRA